VLRFAIEQVEHGVFNPPGPGHGGSLRLSLRRRGPEVYVNDKGFPQCISEIAHQEMAQRIELALPYDVLHFDDQLRANQRDGARVRGDLLAGGDTPGRHSSRFSVGGIPG
jgi:hypothetical protein